MPKPTGYGISGTSDLKYRQSKDTDVSGSTSDLLDEEGNIVNQVVHGVAKEVTEEFFCDSVATAEGLVTSGQFGKNVAIKVHIGEKNNDFCKASLTRRILPDYKETGTAPSTPGSGSTPGSDPEGESEGD